METTQRVQRLQVLLNRLQSRGYHAAPRPGGVADILRGLRSGHAVPESGPQVLTGFVAAEHAAPAATVAPDSLREIAALVASDALEVELVTGAGSAADSEAHEPVSTEVEVIDSEIELALSQSEPVPASDERERLELDEWGSVPPSDAIESEFASDTELTPARGTLLEVVTPAFASVPPRAEPTATAEIEQAAPAPIAGAVSVEAVLRTRVGLSIEVADVVRTARELRDESFTELLDASLELEP